MPDLEHLAPDQARMAAPAISDHRFRANGTWGVLIQACSTRSVWAIVIVSGRAGMPWIVKTADALASATERITLRNA